MPKEYTKNRRSANGGIGGRGKQKKELVGAMRRLKKVIGNGVVHGIKFPMFFLSLFLPLRAPIKMSLHNKGIRAILRTNSARVFHANGTEEEAA
jgi:hypothetical protein